MSKASSYITVAEFILLCDQRVIKELVSDTNTAVSSLSGDSNFAECLMVGSGNMESILVSFNRYTSETLTDIAGETSVASSFLKVMAKNFVLLEVYRRRPDIMARQNVDVDAFQKRIEADAIAVATGIKLLTTVDV